MIQRASAWLFVVLLTGCAAKPPVTIVDEEANPFALPAGSPRDVRVGFVQGYPLNSPSVPLLILPGVLVRPGLRLISRDPRLNPTGELELTSIQGRIALARILSGQPQAKDEAILTAPTADAPAAP